MPCKRHDTKLSIHFNTFSSLGSGSRPHTPSFTHNRPSPSPSSSRTNHRSPDRKKTTSITSPTSSGWDLVDGDGEDDDDQYLYDDEEDEFGLPSIASMRRKRTSKPPGASAGQLSAHSETTTSKSSLEPSAASSAMLSTSFDIAEERNALSYPSTKKGEGKILRPQYKEILTDPANSLHLINHPNLDFRAGAKEIDAHNTRISRINKFKRILQASSVSLSELRSAAWSGVPQEVRAMTWQILLGYLPVNSERRVVTLERKRKEYLDGVRQSFGLGSGSNKTGTNSGVAGGKARGLDEAVWHQISIDVPRTNPHIPLYQFEATQRSLERILYVWAIRNPASGYVQGINDLATPFWQVFLGTYITDLDIESGMDPGQLPKPVLDAVEADTFWCLSKLLSGIQDNYIHAQPGIHRQVAALRDLTTRIDERLAKHFEDENVEYMQFSFRWMNCLLMREISIKSTIRMWDTYLVSTSVQQSAISTDISSRLKRMDFLNFTSMFVLHSW